MIVNSLTRDAIEKAYREDPSGICNLSLNAIVVGAFVRGTLRRLFAEAEIAGAEVSYKEHKALLESTFYSVKIRSDAKLLHQVATALNKISAV